MCGELEVRGHRCIAAVMDFSFLGGSMGAVVGEKLARACERCVRQGPAAGGRHRVGRRADAGGGPGPDADGQDGRRLRGDARRGAADGGGPGPPDHRRRLGVVRLARRRHLRRAGRPDRLLRAARHRADHARDAPRRLRPRRDPARQGADRRGDRPARPDRPHREGPGHPGPPDGPRSAAGRHVGHRPAPRRRPRWPRTCPTCRGAWSPGPRRARRDADEDEA